MPSLFGAFVVAAAAAITACTPQPIESSALRGIASPTSEPGERLCHVTPENNVRIGLGLGLVDGEMSEEAFNCLVDEFAAANRKLVAALGGNLVMIKKWTSTIANAYAIRSTDEWQIEVHGGLARHPKMTEDSYTVVLCHELGHHVGGYPFKPLSGAAAAGWAAVEGQADYYAVKDCARRLWRDEFDINAGFRATIDSAAKAQCDSVWPDIHEQNLCYRIMAASHDMTDALAALRNKTVSFAIHDPTIVPQTVSEHPNEQCRLDSRCRLL